MEDGQAENVDHRMSMCKTTSLIAMSAAFTLGPSLRARRAPTGPRRRPAAMAPAPCTKRVLQPMSANDSNRTSMSAFLKCAPWAGNEADPADAADDGEPPAAGDGAVDSVQPVPIYNIMHPCDYGYDSNMEDLRKANEQALLARQRAESTDADQLWTTTVVARSGTMGPHQRPLSAELKVYRRPPVKPTKLERLEQLAEIEELVANGRWTMAGELAGELSELRLRKREKLAGASSAGASATQGESSDAAPAVEPDPFELWRKYKRSAYTKRRNAPMSTIKEEGEGPLRGAATWLQMCVMGGRGGRA